MNDISIVREELNSAAVQKLISLLNEDLSNRYPEDGANHFRLDEDEVSPGNGAFYVAYLNNQPVGCIAIRKIAEDISEIKRLLVLPIYRRQGIARLLYNKTEETARELNCTKIVGETGERQPEVLSLLCSLGFVRIPLFGEYLNSPLSVCVQKEI